VVARGRREALEMALEARKEYCIASLFPKELRFIYPFTLQANQSQSYNYGNRKNIQR